ncbi:small ubiquitin-related modifier, SUMO [Tanacetum coccineum]|uniref:Small ubiquitin-related modifier, SUMO n=1 Tax=Tanacetum coccineum TaxID=301880 RepID=A0ABQ5BBG8_9ASTR
MDEWEFVFGCAEEPPTLCCEPYVMSYFCFGATNVMCVANVSLAKVENTMSSGVHAVKQENLSDEDLSGEDSPKNLYITVKVTSQMNELDPYFRVRRDEPLKQLMIRWCARSDVGDYKSILFLFDGNRINEKKTPDEFGIEDGDCIDAIMDQTNIVHWYGHESSFTELCKALSSHIVSVQHGFLVQLLPESNWRSNSAMEGNWRSNSAMEIRDKVAQLLVVLLRVIVFSLATIYSLGHLRGVTMSRSSVEAEYRGVANAVAETSWL